MGQNTEALIKVARTKVGRRSDNFSLVSRCNGRHTNPCQKALVLNTVRVLSILGCRLFNNIRMDKSGGWNGIFDTSTATLAAAALWQSVWSGNSRYTETPEKVLRWKYDAPGRRIWSFSLTATTPLSGCMATTRAAVLDGERQPHRRCLRYVSSAVLQYFPTLSSVHERVYAATNPSHVLPCI